MFAAPPRPAPADVSFLCVVCRPDRTLFGGADHAHHPIIEAIMKEAFAHYVPESAKYFDAIEGTKAVREGIFRNDVGEEGELLPSAPFAGCPALQSYA